MLFCFHPLTQISIYIIFQYLYSYSVNENNRTKMKEIKIRLDKTHLALTKIKRIYRCWEPYPCVKSIFPFQLFFFFVFLWFVLFSIYIDTTRTLSILTFDCCVMMTTLEIIWKCGHIVCSNKRQCENKWMDEN